MEIALLDTLLEECIPFKVVHLPRQVYESGMI